MVEDVIVIGTLVKTSFERLAMWSKVLFLLRLVLFVYLMASSSHQRIGTICAFVSLGVVIPLCGHSSAAARNRTFLKFYSYVQGGLSLIILFVVWDTTESRLMLNDVCKECTSVFERGAETCQYQAPSRGYAGTSIGRSQCRHVPSIVEIVCTACLRTMISGVCCCSAFTAQKMITDKYVVAQLMESVPEVEVFPVSLRTELQEDANLCQGSSDAVGVEENPGGGQVV
mgnify:CR=1 FL=1